MAKWFLNRAALAVGKARKSMGNGDMASLRLIAFFVGVIVLALAIYVATPFFIEKPFTVRGVRIVHPRAERGQPVALVGQPIVYEVEATLEGVCNVSLQRFLIWHSPAGPAKIPIGFIRQVILEQGVDLKESGVITPGPVVPGVYQIQLSHLARCDGTNQPLWPPEVVMSEKFIIRGPDEQP